MKFSGVMTAVVTPFTKDLQIDWSAFEALLTDQLQQGVDGIIVCGTTGEASTLTEAEQHALIVKTVQICANKVPVIAGAGHNNTLVAIEKHKKMKELGVDATLQVTPYYNRPSQDGLYHHFKAIADSSDLPIILYNVPSRCGVDMSHETTIRLAEDCPSIVGIKEAAGSIHRLEKLCAGIKREDFSIMSGDDGIILALLALGGHGVISVISHICADQLVEMFKAFKENDLKTAREISYKLIELTDTMFAQPNPCPVKQALCEGSLKGQMQPYVRSPLQMLNKEETKNIQRLLASLNKFHS